MLEFGYVISCRYVMGWGSFYLFINTVQLEGKIQEKIHSHRDSFHVYHEAQIIFFIFSCISIVNLEFFSHCHFVCKRYWSHHAIPNFYIQFRSMRFFVQFVNFVHFCFCWIFLLSIFLLFFVVLCFIYMW